MFAEIAESPLHGGGRYRSWSYTRSDTSRRT